MWKVVTLVILSLCLVPVLVAAQGAPASVSTSGPGTASFLSLPSWSGIRQLDLGALSVTSTVKVGYQKIGLNVNVPVPLQFGVFYLNIDELDFQLKDANVWVGAVEFDAQIRSQIGLFVAGEGSAGRNVRASAPLNPFYIPGSVEWTGSSLEYWRIDGGLRYYLPNGLCVLGGLLHKQFSLKLGDGMDQFGDLNTWGWPFRFDGDLQTKIWIPYLGIEVKRANCKVSFIGSPFASASVKLPIRFFDDYPGWPSWEETRYTIKSPGGFLEGRLDCFAQLPAGATGGFWLRGTWMKMNGSGRADYAEVDPFIGPVDLSASASSNIGCYLLSCGISAILPF